MTIWNFAASDYTCPGTQTVHLHAKKKKKKKKKKTLHRARRQDVIASVHQLCILVTRDTNLRCFQVGIFSSGQPKV